jgi:hypothetical protein
VNKFILCLILIGAFSNALAGQAEKQEKSLDSMRQELVGCAALYRAEINLLESKYDSRVTDRRYENSRSGLGDWISEADKYKISREVFRENELNGSVHQKCVNDAKAQMHKDAKSSLDISSPANSKKQKES